MSLLQHIAKCVARVIAKTPGVVPFFEMWPRLQMAALLASGCKELHVSPAARVTITGGELPHLRLVAREGAIDLLTVGQILKLADELLEKGAAFQSTWDLRACRTPSVAVVARCAKWAVARKGKLDALNKRMAVCMPDNPALLSVVRFVLKMFGPVCPVIVCQVEEECETFMTL